jgi:hypothetical protein
LIGERECVERKCPACSSERKLWSQIIKQTADETTDPPTLYGDLAQRGLYWRTRVVDFNYPIERLSVFDFELVEIVHAEVKRRESFLTWEKNRELEAK